MSGLAIPSALELPAVTLCSNPVLIGGENRSGTTLLSVLLDSHPELVIGPEIDFTEPVNLGPHVLAACDLLDQLEAQPAGATKENVSTEWFDGAHFVVQCERFGLERQDLRILVTDLMIERGTDLFTLEDRCLLIDAIGECRRRQTGASRWGLKLQRRIQDIGIYAAIWPQASFVHIIRDGRDLAASHLKTVPDWGYRSVTEAAHGWLDVVTQPRQAAPAGRYQEVRYEDLITRPRETMTRMLDHLGLPWDEALLHHAEHEHALFNKPWSHPAAEAASQPLYTERHGRYQQDLTPDEIEAFERIAGAALEQFGYALSASPARARFDAGST